MPVGPGTADSGEGAPETPRPTHIDAHIHLESALAQLLLTGGSLLRPPVPGATLQMQGSRRRWPPG